MSPIYLIILTAAKRSAISVYCFSGQPQQVCCKLFCICLLKLQRSPVVQLEHVCVVYLMTCVAICGSQIAKCTEDFFYESSELVVDS